MDAAEGRTHWFQRVLRTLGPGFVTGSSDDDPSGIATYAASGAAFGFAPLWVALVTYPMMAAVQYICAKIGMVSGRGLAGVLRRHYPRPVLYAAVLALLVANTINAGADIGAVADALRLMVPVPFVVGTIVVAIGIVLLQVFGSYRLIARTFKWLALALLAYIGSAFFARPAWREVLRGTVIPTFRASPEFVAMFVALLGTTISPYLFFWQASQEVEEEITVGRVTVRQRRGASDEELHDAAVDVNTGMVFSNIVMYFIILATAATLHRAGHTHIETAAQAALALRPLAGNGATVLLAIGLVGAGLLAVPILTGSAAYAVAEVFGWQHSLTAKPRQAGPFYAVIVASTGIGLLINFLGIKPFDALVWTAVLNGLLAPPLLVLIMRVGNNRRVMGRRVNGRLTNIVGWLTTAVMSLAALALLLTWGAGQ
ncbi:MAG TPA: divalent metal cation transporter [Candidatus Eisenbacteria bacterium]|nr:divalent metal cation transporter [Candidatus Eisenbacteria bacterium]